MEGAAKAPNEKVRRVVGALCGGGAGVRALEGLAVLRRDVLIQADGARRVREAGGLERLVALLRKGTERVQDSALSALATCCLENESCLAVGKLSVSAPLVAIVKTSSRDSVLGRACRLLGNLAQQQVNAESLHAAGAVPALLASLERRDNNTSYPTLTMLVRAIRLLWMITERREEMVTAGAVRAVAVLLAAECESAGLIKTLALTSRQQDGIRKSQEDLFVGILKCLGYFTTLASLQCAEQLQGDGRGYQCLVALTRTHESMALKCLMNLCYVSLCRPVLGIAGIVECLVGVLQKQSDVEWWPEGAARALAQLSEESVNRSRLRHCGGLPLLLAAAKVSHHALHALLQYVFDDTAFQILINEGLVSLLTEELIVYLSTMDYEHDNKEDVHLKVGSGLEPQKISDKSHSSAVERRRNSNASVDELKVVIERDNMIVGFVDPQESFMEVSDEERSDVEEMQDDQTMRLTRKRTRANTQPTSSKSQLIRMASRDWSTSIYWEPKSPELSPCSSRPPVWSPERPDRSPRSPSDRSGQSPEYWTFASQSKRPRWDWSPDSGVGSGSGEGAASPRGEWAWASGSEDSPCSPMSASSNSELSGLYSPVCSEPESDSDDEDRGAVLSVAGVVLGATGPAEAAEAEINTAHVLQELDDLIMEDDDTKDPVQPDDKTECASKCSRIGCVLVLLLRVSHGATPHGSFQDDPATSSLVLELLTRKECLGALLDYVERCRRPLGRAAKILARILSNPLSLTTVLRSRVAMRLRSMSIRSRHPTDTCKQCKQTVHLSKMLMSQMTALVESDYGVGEICYQLLKGPPSIKQTLCVTLPYFVRTHKPLKKYFLDCSALNLLFASIDEAREKMEDCVPALAKLATVLKIKDPKVLERRFKDHTAVCYDPILDDLGADDVVTFQLDDLSTVDANKVFLCQNSEVFRAMLMGQFKESVEKCVLLKKVTKDGLEYMLTLLQCGLNGSECDVQTFPLAQKLETSLEVLLLADRFLLDRLRDLLRSAILQFQLSASTVDQIYVWSLNQGMGVLCVEAVAFLLRGDMCDADRTTSFTNILKLKYRQQWLDDIKSVILRQIVA